MVVPGAVAMVHASTCAMPAADVERIRAALTAIGPAEAKALLPARYTGFSPATHASYATIERAGIAVGRLKKLAA